MQNETVVNKNGFYLCKTRGWGRKQEYTCFLEKAVNTETVNALMFLTCYLEICSMND